MRLAFEKIPFSDREHAERSLEAVLIHEVPGFAENLAEALRDVSDPLRAVIGLNRYFESSPSPDKEAALMASDPKYLTLLTTIFAQSHFLSDMLLRRPEHVAWLRGEAERGRARTGEEMLADLLGQEEAFSSFEEAGRTMRRFRQRAILRIAVREIVDHAPTVSVTEDLSNLADAMLEAALIAARKELEPRYGLPTSESAEGEARGTPVVILAMGKLGGRELNFSSDVDLLFLYGEEGATSGGRSKPITNEEYFKKLGELVIKALAEQTAEGLIFRVDMRLRPYGQIGPLAVTLNSAVDYYTTYGRAWERQALIKARACAGDRGLGAAFLERMRPFVFPKYFDDATLEDIRETKRQTEAMIAEGGLSEWEVKLGRGGIRDIEFTVQMLQLLNGGRWPELRTPNTLEAIDALQRCHCLRPFEANVLERHYLFLRQIEHRLQIEDGRQCHALPEDAAALTDFARRLGYEDGESFLRVYRERAQETREILDQFLAAKGSGHLWVGDLLNPLSDGAAGLKRLAEMGLKEPQRARKELLQLATGNERRPFTRHVHQRFSEITPFLLNALSFVPQPDAILTRLGRILSGLSAPATLYELLHQNPALCHFLVTLVANSEYLCSILVREPDLLDQLSNVDALDAASTRRNLTEDLQSLTRAVDSDAALFRLRDGEMLRIAMRDLVRNITLAQVGDELTQLAEVVLEEALRQAREKVSERYGRAETPFAILGLGKFGGWEMGYGSDLDLVFVYAADGPAAAKVSNSEYFAAVAAYTIRILKEPTRYGILYDIDARLRPDGKKGVLAIDDQRLGQYYREEAQPWERHALMKVRAVAGDAAFAAKIERLAKNVAFSMPLDQTTLEGIESLRRKMVEQASPLDLKKYEGGLAEIEFATRFYQLRYVSEYPALRRGDVFGALDILNENGLIEPGHYTGLRRPYGELRRILNRIRMMNGSHTTELPGEADARAELAGRLGIAGDLLEYVQERRAQVHDIYRQVLDGITPPHRH